MTVVIPTGQYANIQPQVIGIGETFEAAQADALKKANSFYQAVETQADFKLLAPTTVTPEVVAPASAEVMKCWLTGTEIFFDPIEHAYVDKDGNKYLSGSKFAGQYEWEFEKHLILPRYAAKYGVKEYEVEEMWDSKALASTTFGTAFHQALETYIKHYALATKLGKDPLSLVHPTLRPAVESFCTPERMQYRMICEMFVADPDKHRCGQLDLVTIVDEEKKILDIEDYKTNADLFKLKDTKHKTLKAPYQHLPNMDASKYTLQLSFYKDIVEAARLAGWTVREIKLHHWGGNESAKGEDMKWETTVLRPQSTHLQPINLKDYI